MSVGLLDWVPRRATDARFGELRYWRGHWTSRSAACFGMEHFLTYFAAHEGHHRGQLLMIARQLGQRLPLRVTAGVWQWTRFSREMDVPAATRRNRTRHNATP